MFFFIIKIYSTFVTTSIFFFYLAYCQFGFASIFLGSPRLLFLLLPLLFDVVVLVVGFVRVRIPWPGRLAVVVILFFAVFFFSTDRCRRSKFQVPSSRSPILQPPSPKPQHLRTPLGLSVSVCWSVVNLRFVAFVVASVVVGWLANCYTRCLLWCLYGFWI